MYAIRNDRFSIVETDLLNLKHPQNSKRNVKLFSSIITKLPPIPSSINPI